MSESKRGTISQIDYDNTNPKHEKYWVKVKLLKGGSCWIQFRNSHVKNLLEKHKVGDEVHISYDENATESQRGVKFSNIYALDIKPLY